MVAAVSVCLLGFGEAGVAPLMREACARRQDWAGSLGIEPDHASLVTLLDTVLAADAGKAQRAGTSG